MACMANVEELKNVQMSRQTNGGKAGSLYRTVQKADATKTTDYNNTVLCIGSYNKWFCIEIQCKTICCNYIVPTVSDLITAVCA